MPTTGILGQTRRWFIYGTPQPLLMGVTMFENYFSQVGSSIIAQSDPVSVTYVSIVSGSTAGNFQPIKVGRPVTNFGVSVSNPSEIAGYFVGTQAFFSPVLAQNKFGTPDGWGDLGQQAMGGLLLRAPSSGSTDFAHTYYIVAGGDIVIPPSTKVLWSVICKLAQGGQSHNSFLRADTLVNGKSVSTLYSAPNPAVPSKLQLSLGINFSGTQFGSPRVTLQQFEIQE